MNHTEFKNSRFARTSFKEARAMIVIVFCILAGCIVMMVRAI